MSTATASPSPVTARANAFVADRRPEAENLGRNLADAVNDPAEFTRILRDGLQGLSDPAYLEGQRRVAPGIGALHGVRWPLIEAVRRGFGKETRKDRTSAWPFVAAGLLGAPTPRGPWSR